MTSCCKIQDLIPANFASVRRKNHVDDHHLTVEQSEEL